MAALKWLSLYLAVFCLALDASGDYALLPYLGQFGIFHVTNDALRTGAAVTLGLFCFLCCLCWLTSQKRQLPALRLSIFIFLFVTINLIWAIFGLVKGTPPAFAFGDIQHCVLYVCAFFIKDADDERIQRHCKRLFFLFFSIISVKLIVAVVLRLVEGQGVSWRYLNKANSTFIVLFLVSFSLLIQSTKKKMDPKVVIAVAVSASGIVLSNMKGLFLGTAFGLVILSLLIRERRVLNKLLQVSLVGFLMLILIVIFLWESVFRLLIESSLETLDNGLRYRELQGINLMERFSNSPLLGEGFGSFDPTWIGYEAWLPRPYLVELEIFNLLVKLGMVGFVLFAFCWTFYFGSLTRYSSLLLNRQHRAVLIGCSSSIVSLFVASSSNTLYSGILFHLVVFMSLIYAISVMPAMFPYRGCGPIKQ